MIGKLLVQKVVYGMLRSEIGVCNQVIEAFFPGFGIGCEIVPDVGRRFGPRRNRIAGNLTFEFNSTRIRLPAQTRNGRTLIWPE